MALVRNPDTGSQIGLALLRFDLTQTQAAAALNFAELRGRYHRLSGIRSYAEASHAYERGWAASTRTGPIRRTRSRERRGRRSESTNGRWRRSRPRGPRIYWFGSRSRISAQAATTLRSAPLPDLIQRRTDLVAGVRRATCEGRTYGRTPHVRLAPARGSWRARSWGPMAVGHCAAWPKMAASQ